MINVITRLHNRRSPFKRYAPPGVRYPSLLKTDNFHKRAAIKYTTYLSPNFAELEARRGEAHVGNLLEERERILEEADKKKITAESEECNTFMRAVQWFFGKELQKIIPSTILDAKFEPLVVSFRDEVRPTSAHIKLTLKMVANRKSWGRLMTSSAASLA
ncbi:hypothetical protein HZC09_01710 [Candidatus Micrarchaeota archaeon]|nr:hypothetical protein [Candidatus Micrarchaeota archaeon]